jgi:carboxymethylenebutenolidase
MIDETQTNQYLALPANGNGKGILVLHAWWGLNDFMRRLCQRLAEEGYTALAPDLYHGKTAMTIDEAKALRGKLKREQVNADILAGLEALKSTPSVTHPRLGLIGFSLGAYMALGLSVEHPADFGAVSAFYGARNADYSAAQAAYQGHFAETDPYESVSGVKKLEKALKAAGRPATFYTYPGTGHWFFEDDRPDAYNAPAAQLAWKRTLEFLQGALQ